MMMKRISRPSCLVLLRKVNMYDLEESTLASGK